MRERSAGCMFFMSSILPAATRTKSQGSGSVFTSAPELISLWPVMEYFFSCIAVSSSCCERGPSEETSSTKSTPLFARWIAPASTLKWAGVPSPPDCKGSCRTSPSSAPAFAPVASMKGAFFRPVLSWSCDEKIQADASMKMPIIEAARIHLLSPWGSMLVNERATRPMKRNTNSSIVGDAPEAAGMRERIFACSSMRLPMPSWGAPGGSGGSESFESITYVFTTFMSGRFSSFWFG